MPSILRSSDVNLTVWCGTDRIAATLRLLLCYQRTRTPKVGFALLVIGAIELLADRQHAEQAGALIQRRFHSDLQSADVPSWWFGNACVSSVEPGVIRLALMSFCPMILCTPNVAHGRITAPSARSISFSMHSAVRAVVTRSSSNPTSLPDWSILLPQPTALTVSCACGYLGSHSGMGHCHARLSYLSSPTGGGVRHGMDLNASVPLDLNQARLFCNLARSYILFLLAEHRSLLGGD